MQEKTFFTASEKFRSNNIIANNIIISAIFELCDRL